MTMSAPDPKDGVGTPGAMRTQLSSRSFLYLTFDPKFLADLIGCESTVDPGRFPRFLYDLVKPWIHAEAERLEVDSLKRHYRGEWLPIASDDHHLLSRRLG